ncbi:hypothetical protein SS50377_25536 [Spironucleus salmonicida]|uniref:Uncharacterized protein n=1 Tax=Spironucleus salmonicida TaxID=348837 RepID=V6LW95_9EUKA|nr:hypothetical protein SS50377_25536 [Spironucleus salmonicida]|eukprot:EST45084.1 Hypothetical protein SS50377_15104 [Spironucleus salmonicida]
MFSQTPQQLKTLLTQFNINDDVVECLLEDVRTQNFENKISTYYENGEVRTYIDIESQYQINPLLLAAMTDQVKFQNISDSLELPNLLNYAAKVQSSVVLLPCQFVVPSYYKDIYENSTDTHSLCLDDIIVRKGIFSVEGRNLIDLDFMEGSLGSVYSSSICFNFSHNPMLKLSQIRKFLEINQFKAKQIIAVNINIDCDLQDEITLDQKLLQESYFLNFVDTSQEYSYQNCKKVFIDQSDLPKLTTTQFPNMKDLCVSFSTEFQLSTQIQKQLTSINNQQFNKNIFFIINNEVTLDYQQINTIKNDFDEKISRAKILFTEPIERTTLNNGQILLTNTENNAAFVFFEGLINNKATLTSLSESNILNIYHQQNNQVFQILIQKEQILKNQPLYLFQSFWPQKLAQENAFLNLIFSQKKFPKLQFPSFDNSSIFNVIRQLNASSIISKEPIIGYFEPMPISISLLCCCQSSQFISELFTLHNKFEAIQLLLSGQIKNLIPFTPEKNVVIQINEGVVQQFTIEFKNAKQPEFSVLDQNVSPYIAQLKQQFGSENLTVICDLDCKFFSILQIK